MVYIIPLCYVTLSKVVLCLLPSCFMLLSSAPSRPTMLPLQSSGGTTRKELALGGKYCIIYNALILPSTGYAGDLGDAQLQSGGPRRSTCLDLPRDLVLERLSYLNLFEDPPVQGSQKVVTPRPAQGFNHQEAVTSHLGWGSSP